MPFFVLCFFIGFLNFILIIPKKGKKIYANIRDLTIINEQSMTIGFFLLTVGTFLGGVWANESWGRYWGWDQKETWALVIVLCYAWILHFRFIPGFRGKIAFNVGSLWGFSSVLMTFVGVNYYLSKGLHSYAAGDTPAFPVWAWVMIVLLAILSFVAVFQQPHLALE